MSKCIMFISTLSSHVYTSQILTLETGGVRYMENERNWCFELENISLSCLPWLFYFQRKLDEMEIFLPPNSSHFSCAQCRHERIFFFRFAVGNNLSNATFKIESHEWKFHSPDCLWSSSSPSLCFVFYQNTEQITEEFDWNWPRRVLRFATSVGGEKSGDDKWRHRIII